MRVFLSAGEASGDSYAAELVEEVRRLAPVVADARLQRFRERLETVAGRSVPLDDRLPLQESVIDSLELVEYMMFAEDEFDVELSEQEFGNLTTIGDLLRYLAARTGVDISGFFTPATPVPPLTYKAIGGSKSKGAGVPLVADSSNWGSIGIVQVFRSLWPATIGFRRAKQELEQGKPGLFIPIDFGYFNIRLARHAKRAGWKVLYWMPPGSWRRDKQGNDLPGIADEIVTPFPWSAEILNEMGGKCHWFGHPLKQLIRESGVGVTRRAGNVIAVLPGSRRHEIELNLPLIVEAVRGTVGIELEFGLAKPADKEEVERIWSKVAPERTVDKFLVGQTRQVLSRANSAIVCSGTATLEAALCRCPMVVVYRVSRGMAMQAKIAGFKPEFVSLPNILLQRQAVPELVNENAVASLLRVEIEKVHRDDQTRDAQIAAFDEIDMLAGSDDAITRTAQLALDLIRAID